MSAAAPDLGAAAPGAPAPAAAEPAPGALRSAQPPEAPPSAGLPEPPTDEARQLAALEEAVSSWGGRTIEPGLAALQQLGAERGVLLASAHELRLHGFTPEQVAMAALVFSDHQQRSMPTAMEQVEAEAAHVEAELQSTLDGLREKWGDAFDHNIRSAQAQMIRVFADDAVGVEDLELADGTRLGNHVGFIAAMAAAAQRASAVRATGMVPPGEPEPSDPAVWQDLSEEFAYQHRDSLLDSTHPRHAARLAQWHSLVAKANEPPLPARVPSHARQAATPAPRGTRMTKAAEPAQATPPVTREQLDAFQAKFAAQLTDRFHVDHQWALTARRELLERLRESAA